MDQQIDKEREGEQIDRALLKNVIDIFVEIGMGQMELYELDFEAQMLLDSGAYYSRKASNWIVDDSCPDYMLKASLCTQCFFIIVLFMLITSVILTTIILFICIGWGVLEKGEGQGFSLSAYKQWAEIGGG